MFVAFKTDATAAAVGRHQVDRPTAKSVESEAIKQTDIAQGSGGDGQGRAQADEGHPMNAMALNVGKSDAKTFFEGACASYLASHREHCQAMGGSVAFSLRGAAGGIWTIDMTNARVLKGVARADVTVHSTASDFAAVFSGKRSAMDAFADGSMRCEGDVNVLVRFAAMLNSDETQ